MFQHNAFPVTSSRCAVCTQPRPPDETICIVCGAVDAETAYRVGVWDRATGKPRELIGSPWSFNLSSLFLLTTIVALFVCVFLVHIGIGVVAVIGFVPPFARTWKVVNNYARLGLSGSLLLKVVWYTDAVGTWWVVVLFWAAALFPFWLMPEVVWTGLAFTAIAIYAYYRTWPGPPKIVDSARASETATAAAPTSAR